MPYPSPADDMGNGGCLAAFAALALLAVASAASAAIGLFSAEPAPAAAGELPIVYDTPAEEPEGMTVLPQAEGPIYDAPQDVEQSVVCDRSNRAYILLETPEGGIAITPYLDESGNQVIIPQA